MGDAQLIETLQIRLQKKKIEKERKEEHVRNLGTQISSLLRSAPSRPSPSFRVVKEKMDSLERERTTVSMSLTREKNILKEIKRLSVTLRLHQQFEHAQEKANRIRSIQDDTNLAVRTIDKQIEELNKGLRKVLVRSELYARGIDVRVADIVERETRVRIEDLPYLANMESMESKFAVVMKLDKIRLHVRISGIGMNVGLAERSILQIVSTAMRSIDLSPARSKLLDLNLDKLSVEAEKRGVSIHIGPRTCWIRGKDEGIASIEAMLNKSYIEDERVRVDLKHSREIGIVVGRGGSRIRDLQTKHGV
eukprot:g3864.t1